MSSEVSQIELRCEADYFGFSYQLATYLGLRTPPISNTTLAHGWNPFKPRIPERYFHTSENIKLVQNHTIAEFLRQLNHEAYSVGIPFINFLKFFPNKPDRLPNSVLIAMRHSHPHFSYSPTEVAEALAAWAIANYETVAFLVPPKDLAKYQSLQRIHRGIKFELGAEVSDPKSFMRLQNHFSTYDHLVSTSFGSQLLYGAACGMKVGISRLFFEPYSESDFSQNPWYRRFPQLITEILNDYSLEGLQTQLPELLIEAQPPMASISAPCFQNDTQTTDPYILAKTLGWPTRPSHLDLNASYKLKNIGAHMKQFSKRVIRA
ncbi:MAG: hypothetical protein ACK5QT_04370 [Oligoflexia bacterium]